MTKKFNPFKKIGKTGIARSSDWQFKQPLKWNRQREVVFSSWERQKEEWNVTDSQLTEKGFVKPERPIVKCDCDVFQDGVDQGWVYKFWALIKQTPFLDWVVYTKNMDKVNDVLPPDWVREMPENIRIVEAGNE